MAKKSHKDLHEKLRGTLNAKIFRRNSEMSITALKKIFKAARGESSAAIHTSIRKAFKDRSLGTYSLLIFKRRSSVSFLESTDHKEILYGYLLIIETGNLLFAFGKRTLDYKEEIFRHFAFIVETELVGASLSEDSNIRRLRSSTVSPGSAGKTSKVHIGSDLQSGLGSVFNNRSLLQNIGAIEGGRYISLNFSEAKISQYGKSVALEPIAKWAKGMRASIEAQRGSNRFVSTFAAVCAPIDAGEPRAIYFHLDDIAALIIDRM